MTIYVFIIDGSLGVTEYSVKNEFIMKYELPTQRLSAILAYNL